MVGEDIMSEQRKPTAVGGRLALYRALDELRNTGGVLVFVRADELAAQAEAGVRGADYAMHELGRQLVNAVSEDQRLFRFSNNEYALIVAGKSAEEGQRLAERLHKSLAHERFAAGEGRIALGIETASHPVRTNSVAEQVILRARRALARAAAPAPAIREETADIDWGTRVERALEEDGLAQAYQSLVPLGRQRHDHFDVLLRLLDPQRGRIPAAEFLPAAEEKGLMGRIDQWVLETALDVAQAHAGGGLPTALIMRISEATLLDTEAFLERQVAARRARRLNDQRLVFALPEWLLFQHLREGRRLAEAAADDPGLGLLIDGFGAERHGGQDLLELLPAEYVRLYVRPPDEREHSLADVIRLAHGKRAKVVAPHVERSETLVELTQLGVDFLQGHFIQLPQTRPVREGSTRDS